MGAASSIQPPNKRKGLRIFIAGLAVGWLATSAYFIWKEYKCLDLAMFVDPDVTQAEAQRLFAGCYVPILRFTSRKKWEAEMKQRAKRFSRGGRLAAYDWARNAARVPERR